MGSLYNSDANAAITQAFNPATGALKIEGGAAGSGAGTEYVEDVASVGGEQGPLVMGIRQDSDVTPVSANGDYHPFIFNEVGRLKTASAPAQYTAATGNITANAQTITADVTQVSNLMVHCFGTFAGSNVTFEGSLNSTNGTDGNWFGIQAVRTNANTVEATTGVLGAAPAYGWELSVNALKWFRVRATAFTSGTQSWVFTLGSFATEPIPAIQTHAVTQSGAFTITLPTASVHTLTSAATTNATNVKATAGHVYELTVDNFTASIKWFKLYNKATAPTVGTDVPVLTIPVPANSYVTLNFGTTGKRFATGIGIAITGAQAVADTTAVAAGDTHSQLSYI
jgi:hypothetical protein